MPVTERPSFAGPADVVPDPEAKVESPSDEEGISELRSLLLGPAEKQLADVHSRLTDPQRQLKEVAHLLPAAIAVRSRQDDELTDAMAPTVAAALRIRTCLPPRSIANSRVGK